MKLAVRIIFSLLLSSAGILSLTIYGPPSRVVFAQSSHKATATLKLIVRDGASGKAVPSDVSARNKGGLRRLSTGADGTVSYQLLNGRNDFAIHAVGYEDLQTHFEADPVSLQTVTVWLDPVELPFELRNEVVTAKMRPGYAMLHGHVLDSGASQPIAGAHVYLECAGVESQTDDRGYFLLYAPVQTINPTEELPTSDTLVVSSSSFKTYRRTNVTIAAGATHFIIDMDRGEGLTEVEGTHKLKLSSMSDKLQFVADPEENESSRQTEVYRTSSEDLPPVSLNNREGIIEPSSVTIPTSIRVGSNCPTKTTCTTFNVYSLDTYVKNGLDDEWFSSWNAESLKAGAIAYRSYGVYYVYHPLTANYDICNTTSCQVNDPTDSATSTNNAVNNTTGVIVVDSTGNNPFFAEYAAENNDSACADGFTGSPNANWSCLSDPVDAGQTFNGHGRGMCQWGTQRWAVNQGKDYVWIVNHYYNDNGNLNGARSGVLQFPQATPTPTPTPAPTPTATATPTPTPTSTPTATPTASPSPSPGPSAIYTFVDLGTLGGTESAAYAINYFGQVVGSSQTANGESHAFLYTQSVTTDLNSLIPPNSGWILYSASGINDAGQIVGSGRNPAGQTHSFLYNNGAIIDVGSFAASAINNNGQVVGVAGVNAVVWKDGQTTNLGTIGGPIITACCINNSGQAVGSGYTNSQATTYHAFLWDQINGIRDLGALGTGTNSYSTANGINSLGQVVGWTFAATGGQRAFLYRNSAMQDLGTLHSGEVSYATGVNDSGQVIGSSGLFSEAEHAFIWTGSNGMRDLNDLTIGSIGTLRTVNAINSSGQIVGGKINNQPHAFLLNPGSAPTPTPTPTPTATPTPAPTPAFLRNYAQNVGFYVGAAVNMSPFRNEPQYTNTLKREFNVIVAENAFKFDATHPAQSTYNFNDTDALVSFAEANGMKIRGHTLVWHNQLPSWVTSCNCTRDQAIQIMSDHIKTLVGRYRGRVWAWDVVNEAIDDSTGGLRTNSFWYQKIGPDYIDMAFRFAREADPNTLLYYNDYSIEGLGTKSNAAYNLVSMLKNNGVPIDGVGWQSHFVNPFRVSQANHTNAQRLAALGLQVSITELDVRIQSPTTTDKLDQQALAYRDLVDLSMSEPNINALVMWGFTDKYSWIPGAFAGYGDALTFDVNYQPKPSYYALRDGLRAAASLDIPKFFARQQYLDFLGREPDGAGLIFWTNQITGCGIDAQCIEAKRINVSAAFFLSIEFQQTGYLVERMYKAAYGDATGSSFIGGTHQLPVPIVRFNEFLPDTQRIGQGVIVGQTGWETVLENNKQAFASEFVQRSRFTDALPTSLTPAQFVDKLFQNAGVTPSATDRNAAITEFGSSMNTSDAAARARTLRDVAENSILNSQEFNRAFVLMEYFGYLRRNPNDPPEATQDYSGYDFWLNKLSFFNGNYIQAEMVKAFITSSEYRQRFGP